MATTRLQIVVEDLLPLIESKRILWDKTCENYKNNKQLRSAAWREICCDLNPDFERMGPHDQKLYADRVSAKWINIRDAFVRSCKKQKESGNHRPYVFKEQLKFFLNAMDPERQGGERCSHSPQEAPVKTIKTPTLPVPKRHKTNSMTVVSKTPHSPVANASDLDESPHLMFMRGMLPALSSFDIDETLELQSGIIGLIRGIKRKRHASYLHSSSTDTFAQCSASSPLQSDPIDTDDLEMEIKLEHE